MSKREDLEAEIDAAEAELAELRALLAERKRELWAANGLLQGEDLITADVDETTAAAARKFALERICNVLDAKIAGLVDLQRARQQRLTIMAVSAKNAAGHIAALEKDLAPGGKYDRQIRAAQNSVTMAERERVKGEEELEASRASLARLWGDAPIIEFASNVVRV